MPVKLVVRRGDPKPFQLVDDAGKVKGRHTVRARAVSQLRLLNTVGATGRKPPLRKALSITPNNSAQVSGADSTRRASVEGQLKKQTFGSLKKRKKKKGSTSYTVQKSLLQKAGRAVVGPVEPRQGGDEHAHRARIIVNEDGTINGATLPDRFHPDVHQIRNRRRTEGAASGPKGDGPPHNHVIPTAAPLHRSLKPGNYEVTVNEDGALSEPLQKGELSVASLVKEIDSISSTPRASLPFVKAKLRAAYRKLFPASERELPNALK